jgi:hypothetical protein
MILEGLVTTTSADGTMHLTPMGPTIAADWSSFRLRPFPTSNTFRNLKERGYGVLHVTDDVLLLAKAALGQLPSVETRRASKVNGFVVIQACRYYEFVVRSMDESQQRMQVECDVVHRGHLRDFFGFNRAKHAVLEGAILATRLHLLPRDEIEAEFKKLAVIVEKTAGPQEVEAFAFLENYIRTTHPQGEAA